LFSRSTSTPGFFATHERLLIHRIQRDFDFLDTVFTHLTLGYDLLARVPKVYFHFLHHIEMLKIFFALLGVFAGATAFNENYTQVGIVPSNNCIQFSVGSGTGCAWMCNYCANQLGTFNYYFTDGVCTYQTGGCVGNPVAGKTYSCCSV
jgi:hypothetical protein